jgi:hypothetical protein
MVASDDDARPMSLLATLGLRPDGDPAAMRAYAESLRRMAAQIADAGTGSSSAVGRATFEGPAGDATRFRAGRMKMRATARATALRALADAIAQRAGDVERGQHAWDGLRDRLEREARNLAGQP